MTFTRRFFVSVAAAVSAWGLAPRKAYGKRDTLADRFRGPEKPPFKPESVPVQAELEPKMPCETVFQVSVMRTQLPVKSGQAVYNGCEDGTPKPVGMAMTDANPGEPVMFIQGFIPKGAPTDPR